MNPQWRLEGDAIFEAPISSYLKSSLVGQFILNIVSELIFREIHRILPGSLLSNLFSTVIGITYI